MSLLPSTQRWKDEVVPNYPEDVRERLGAMTDAQLICWLAAQVRYMDYEQMARELREAGCDHKTTRLLILRDQRTKVSGIASRMVGWKPEYPDGRDFDEYVAAKEAEIDREIAEVEASA